MRPAEQRVSVAHVATIAESLKLLLLDQLLALRSAGYDVTGISAPGEAVAALDEKGVRYLEAPFVRSSGLTPFADLRAMGALARTFRRERFTIVHTHTAKPDLYASMAAKLAGVPLVVTTLHGFYFHDLMPPRTRRFYVELAKLGMRFADAVLSQNPEDVETAIREKLCPPEKISFLGNGIDIKRFDRSRFDASVIAKYRKELGIADDVKVIGFVGRLVQDKGILELLEALQAVRQRHPKLHVILIGWIDRAKADVIDPKTAEKYGVADICSFLGHREDIAELYALMDVFVLPSYREGFPRSVMEASATSVPVIATNVRGCRTAVEDGRSGVLVPLKDIGALADAICALLDDPVKRKRMGDEGRKIAVARFDQQLVFDKVLATYDRLLARKT